MLLHISSDEIQHMANNLIANKSRMTFLSIEFIAHLTEVVNQWDSLADQID